MKVVVLAMLFSFGLLAQEHAAPAPAGAEAHDAAKGGTEHASGDPFLLYKWINFGVLFAGLAYLAMKTGGPFLRARSQSILDDLNIAVKRSEEAAARAAEIEKRMAILPAEIEKLRAVAKTNFQAEADRIQAETSEQLAKVEASAQQEILSAAKEATNQLRAYSAELALKLAEQKIQGRINAADQAALINRFVASLPVAERKS